MIRWSKSTVAAASLGLTGTPTLQAESVSVFADQGGRAILDSVSVTIHPGRVHAIVGPNGAGKSTLFGVLAGDISRASGQVTLADVPLTDIGVRELARHRAVLMQHNSVSFSFTVADVVEMGRAPWAGAGDDFAIVDSAMRATDVAHLADRSVSSLSGGERARVALARVLVQQAPVMLWDEPTAALDLAHQEGVLQLARVRAAAGDAIAVVLHDLGAALAYADDVTLLADGRVVATGSPSDVLTAERVSAIYGQRVDVFPHPKTGIPLLVPNRE